MTARETTEGVLLSLGHGYVAEALAERLGPGWRVIGTTRDEDKAARLRAAGREMLVWPGESVAPALAAATHVLASAAPGEDGDPFLAELAPELHVARARWVGYLSTTGVYGDHDGDWVDEDTPLAPGTVRGQRRVLAERQWQVAAREAGWPLHIFRLGGIYGPGRAPFDRLRAGTARRIVKPGQVFSRIHVDDIAEALALSMAHPTGTGRAAAIYNLVDDAPGPPGDVLVHAAGLIGVAPPPEVPLERAGLSEAGRSFYAECKRVSNARIKRALGFAPRYPSYREGLPAVLAEE